MIGIIISMILPKKKSYNKDEPNKPNTGEFIYR